MAFGYEFSIATGTSVDDCNWLGYRFTEGLGFRPEQGDSWIAKSDSGTSYSLLFQNGWITGLWRTESCVWASHVAGQVHMNTSHDVRRKPWQTFHLNCSLKGIWGLRDDLVFTWGIQGSKQAIFVFNGSSWSELESPGCISAIHGTRDDLIYAAGLKGLIARWNGECFEAVQSCTGSNLSSIFVATNNEMYACGHGGELLHSTPQGWELLLKHKDPLYCVAEWADNIWIGAGAEGLFKLGDKKLDMIKPNVHAKHLDTRGSLLISTPEVIASTDDGKVFTGFPTGIVKILSNNEVPHPDWEPLPLD